MMKLRINPLVAVDLKKIKEYIAEENNFKTLILDTPKNTERAHKFYERAGFIQINKEDLPIQFDYPYKDCHFLLLNL